MIERSAINPILVVEDSPEDYEVLTRAFKKAEILLPLRHCKDGAEAMDYLKCRGEYQNDTSCIRPAFVLMDLNLPGVDGTHMIQQIKDDPTLTTIPLIVFTTSRSEKDVEETYRAGANSFMPKPVDMEGYVKVAQILKSYWFEYAILP
ncbi:MAG TPA: response regulator [Alphaproteobacteria bacterium]